MGTWDIHINRWTYKSKFIEIFYFTLKNVYPKKSATHNSSNISLIRNKDIFTNYMNRAWPYCTHFLEA